MDRMEAFDKMLEDLICRADYEAEQLKILKAAGKEKTATYRQYLGNKMLYAMMFDKFREYGLME